MGKKGDETKRLILEKAMALFAKKGFKNVTMKDICIDTGLSRGGLYRHYESTNQIFSEIIDILMNTQDNELSSKIENEVPAPVILDEILERYKKEMLDSSGSLSIAILEFYSENQPSDNDNVLFEQYLYSKDMWSYFISYGVNRGEFNNVNSEEIIDMIIFSYQGVRMFSTIMPIDEQIPNRIINHIKKALLI
ncbi:TetR family transcriptional regulator [Drancourtella sp. An210]|nr:TetR family transcriptional regulator [Drancourtella sp. An210]